MTTYAPRFPTFRDVARHRTPTATGAILTGYALGPRWARIAIDRDFCWLPNKRWPDGSTRPLLAQLAGDMSTLFVNSHSSGICYVSSFTSDIETLHTPTRCADAMVALLVFAELGDTSLVDWFGPMVHDAAEQVRAMPTRRDRTRHAGRITDAMAQTIAEKWRPSKPTTERMTDAET